MKKALCLLLLSVLYITAGAQEKVFSFGPKAGFSMSNLSNKPAVRERPGFYAGMLFHIKLNTHWRLQPEVYFSQQGARQPKGAAHYKTTEYYNYLVLPILVQYRFAKRFYVEAGAQPGILVNGRLRTYYDESGLGTGGFTSHHENTFDLIVPAGAGYQLNSHFGFNVRYNQGITNIRRYALAAKERNQVLQAGAYMFF